MSVESHLIEHEGRYAGHALQLGERLKFHTARADLSCLNEECFESVQAVQIAVADTLAPLG